MDRYNKKDLNIYEVAQIKDEHIKKKCSDFIVELADYLRKLEYNISTSEILDLSNLVGDMNIFNFDDFIYSSRCVLCKNPLEYECYEDNVKAFLLEKIKDDVKQRLSNNDKKEQNEIDAITKEYSNKRDEINDKQAQEMNELADKLSNNQKLKVFKEHSQKLENLNSSDKRYLDDLLKDNSSFTKNLIYLSIDTLGVVQEKDIIQSDIQNIMFQNIVQDNNVNINELLLAAMNTTIYIEKSLKKQQRVHKKEKEVLESTYNQKISDVKNTNTIIKDSILSHREDYKKGHNAVQLIQNIKDKQISKLTKEEYDTLIYYIRQNAHKFRTKISRSMKQSKNKVFDYKKTIENSRKYFGEPMELCYKKPIVKKYKLYCVLDISGSVSKHLSLLTNFVYELSIVFNGGINILGFVNSIIDYTEDYKNKDISTLVREMQYQRGYSSYGKAISDFYEDYYHNLDSNTVVIFFGDARNNKNETSEDKLKKISEKVRSIIWLNPEPKEDWNTGDSIIDLYNTYVNNLYKVETTTDLTYFLENIEV